MALRGMGEKPLGQPARNFWAIRRQPSWSDPVWIVLAKSPSSAGTTSAGSYVIHS